VSIFVGSFVADSITKKTHRWNRPRPPFNLVDVRDVADLLFDPGIRSVVGQLGRKQEYSSAAAEALGWAP
jgi:hypothetical protein